MAKLPFAQLIQQMSPEELSVLEESLLNSAKDIWSDPRWNNISSQRDAAFQKIKKAVRVAAVRLGENTDEFEARKKELYAVLPKITPLTKEQKEEKIVDKAYVELALEELTPHYMSKRRFAVFGLNGWGVFSKSYDR